MRPWWAVLVCLLLLACAVKEVPTNQERSQNTSSREPPMPEEEKMTLTLTSNAFEHNTDMPKKYTCQGDDTSPPLAISGVPENTKSLVLIMDDPDAPDPAAPRMVWDHWVVFNIPPDTKEIAEGTSPEGLQGTNSWIRHDYGGPCPPVGKHRYFFKLYALDTTLDLSADANKASVMAAMDGHILEQAELIGLYQKS